MKLKNTTINEDLERWIEAYLKHIQVLSYSNNTFLLYRRILLELVEYSLDYQDEMSISDIKTTFLVNFLNYLENNAKNSNKLSKRTKMTYLRVLTSFFSFISDNNDDLFIFSFDMKKIRFRTEKAEEKLNYLNENEIIRLNNVLEKEKSKKEIYNSFRNALLIKLMLYGGLRISEALNVKLCDFEEVDDNILKISIIGKGGKEQFAFIKKEEVSDELEYFKENIQSNDHIMKTSTGKHLNRSNAFLIVNKIYAKALINKKGLHLLRHTLAMRLTAKGINLVVIQKILRHANLNTTTIYAKATNDTIKNALL
ncbi:recombinase XerC [Campylobacter novaezeelandiae]|uniref:tyrosine-type recombinase/integrase n=1 Tax=Campylobacter novaezeelandiae TaxID=2267891 RepID=UPI0010375479|nr:tyrosine-type recombinase/integrase [Campylobacter novaezeelandiae]TBR80903.1 recombinase XerC [Campylobacter novaezeelandiae]